MAFDAHSPELQSFFSKLKTRIKGFGTRVLVHSCALASAFVVSSLVPATHGQDFAFLGTYIGIICLVARDMARHASWFVPTILGFLQMLFCFSLGFPLHQGIFWGGFQSYIQRLFAKNFAMGSEWIMPLFLVPLSFSLGAYIHTSWLWFGTSFAIFITLGWMYFTASRYKEKQKARYEQLHSENKEPAKEEVTTTSPEDPFKEFHTSIAKLRMKLIFLPENLKKSVQSVINSAESIVLCMAEDERDTEAGRRFLHRYLPAVHSVLDKYQRLSLEKTTVNVHEALEQSVEILVRLEKAFIQEHENLLQNNVDDFSAELQMLDTLLKMEGK